MPNSSIIRQKQFIFIKEIYVIFNIFDVMDNLLWKYTRNFNKELTISLSAFKYTIIFIKWTTII